MKTEAFQRITEKHKKPTMSFETFIAGRYLWARHKQVFISLINFLSIAGVTVGVMTLIAVLAVMTGSDFELKARILGIQPHVLMMRHGGAFSEYRPVIQTVREMDGVKNAAPFVYAQVMLRSASGIEGAVLKGILPESSDVLIYKTALKSLNSDPDSRDDGSAVIPGIVLGKELAEKLGVRTGQLVDVITPSGMSSVSRLPSIRRLEVRDAVETGMYEYDSTFGYVSLGTAQKILGMGEAVTGIEVQVDDVYKADAIAERIDAAIGFPYWTVDWMQRNSNIFTSLKIQKAVMFIIFSLIILVAGFSITSALIMSVIEKTRDISILKAMGASNRSIRKIFILKGMAIGALGTGLGMTLGFLLCEALSRYQFVELPKDVYFFSTLPVRIEAFDVLSIVGAAFLICLLATLYPAIRASRLNPVDGIRNR